MSIGIIIAFVGAALVSFLCCLGSAIGVRMVGEAANGLLCEKPEHFSKALILEVLPGTQGLYGLVICFFVLLKVGVFTGVIADITIMQGILFLIACLPMTFGGLVSAMYQARVAVTGVNIISKQPDDWAKGVITTSMVEFYAILSLLASFLMLMSIL